MSRVAEMKEEELIVVEEEVEKTQLPNLFLNKRKRN